MKIEESDDFCVILLRLVADPICEATRLDSLKWSITSKRLRARVVLQGGAVPFEAEGAVEVDTFAEADSGLLAVLAPKTIGFPRVDITIWIKSRDENPIKFFEEFRHGRGFAIGSDEGVGNITDTARADPFAGVGAAGDDDGFSGGGGFFGVRGVDAYS